MQKKDEKTKKSRVKLALGMFIACVVLISLAVLLAMSGQYGKLIIKERVYEIESGSFGIENKLKWTFNSDNTLVISGNGRMEDFEKRGQCDWKSYLEQTRKIVIEDGVKNIGANVFNGCGASQVILGNSIESIGKLAFANCVNLKEISFPQSVQIVGDGAFMGCLYLKNAEMQDGIKTIWDNAFDMCHTDFRITAPQGSAGAEYNANKLGQIPVLEDTRFDDEFNVVDEGSCGKNVWWTLYKDGRLIVGGEGNIEDYEDVSSVPWYNYRDLIKNIEVRQGVEYIGKNAFMGCSEVKEAKINCLSIGDAAFYGCTALEKAEICNGASSINDEAFARCISLKEIHIPPTVKTIKYNAFKENPRDLKIYGDTRSYARFYALTKFIGFRQE